MSLQTLRTAHMASWSSCRGIRPIDGERESTMTKRKRMVREHFGRKVAPFYPIVEQRDCVACGKRFEVTEPGGQDACSKRCVRAYVLGKRAKKGTSNAL